MTDNVETMFSAREVPWHGLGTVTEDALTAKDALVAAGLDWDVELADAQAVIHGATVTVPNSRVTYRSTDGQILGAHVGSTYQVVQNRDAFAFLDTLTGQDLKFETAGSLRNGKVVFMTTYIPENILIGGEDAVRMYLFLRNSHDGSTKLGCYPTPIRVVCENTSNMAVAGAKNYWEMRHNNTLQGRIQEARDTMQLTFAYTEKFKALGEKLIATKITEADFKNVLESVIPVRPKSDETIADIIAVYNDSQTNGYKGTGWGAVNAVTEYFDHVKAIRSEEARLLSLLGGQAFAVVNKVTELISA